MGFTPAELGEFAAREDNRRLEKMRKNTKALKGMVSRKTQKADHEELVRQLRESEKLIAALCEKTDERRYPMAQELIEELIGTLQEVQI